MSKAHPQSAIIVICGSTATGKSAQALRLAEKLGSPLLSADSRQVYRGLDIGTAKPTVAEQARWPHHLIDIADPTERFTVAQYQVLAQELLAKAHEEGRIPIIVGGTGLYIQAISEGLGIPRVPPQPALRHHLESWPQSLRHQTLQQVDPVAAARIHAHDQVRTLRALEVYYVTGKPASEQQEQRDPPFRVLRLGLRCEMKVLEKRIAGRAQQMLEMGWIPEVEGLRRQYGQDLPLLQTLGYGEIGQYLDGKLPKDELIPTITLHTRQFAKRQLTWFRRAPNLIWMEAEDPRLEEEIDKQVDEILTAKDPWPS